MLRSLALLLALASGAALAQPDPGAAVDSTAVPDSLAAAAPATMPFAPLAEALAGVVWTPPDSLALAVEDLEAMRRAGIRAVRTGLVDDDILAAADRLGLSVAQTLPIADLPAAALMRIAPEAEALFTEALDRARPHPSARLFILARGVDTSDPRALPFFERMTALARERGAAGTRTAYLTRFVDDDQAASGVDLVLLDARGQDPFDLLRRWRATHETPVGLGAWGVGVAPGREGGWRRSGTLAHQARTVERVLNRFAVGDAPPEVAFLARWRDREERDARAAVADLRYGLIAEDGETRPALDVASGVFTGRQRVFAFDAGPPERARGSGLLVLFGWALALALGALLTASPRLGGLVPQYFGRRDLYREAVQKGYGLSGAVTATLAVLLALIVGVVGATILRAFGATDALAVATSGWEPESQRRITDLVGSPAILGMLIALLYAAWTLFNVVWVGVLAGKHRRLRSAQALSLVVWTRWPWLLLLLGAMLVSSLSPETAGPWAATLLVAAFVVETLAAYRTQVDLMFVGAVGPVRALAVGFGFPFVLVLVVGIAALIGAGDELGFLWHLAVRS